MKLNLRGVPEKFKKDGVFGHYRILIQVGDTVEAICNVHGGTIPLGTKIKVADILIEPNGNDRGFTKRIQFEGYKGEFNPKKFKKI